MSAVNALPRILGPRRYLRSLWLLSCLRRTWKNWISRFHRDEVDDGSDAADVR